LRIRCARPFSSSGSNEDGDVVLFCNIAPFAAAEAGSTAGDPDASSSSASVQQLANNSKTEQKSTKKMNNDHNNLNKAHKYTCMCVGFHNQPTSEKNR
jgi:hypothetical protein